jgi:hypothetical protein
MLVTESGLFQFQVKIVSEKQSRFTLSNEDPVILKQDCHFKDCTIQETDQTFSVSLGETPDSDEPRVKVVIIKNPFVIKQYINGVHVISVNQ